MKTPTFKISQTVYHAANADMKGIVIALIYYAHELRYFISFGPEYGIQECHEHELTAKKPIEIT